MNFEVKVAADDKMQLFVDYLDIPEEYQPAFAEFVSDYYALAVSSKNVQEFELRFSQFGLAARYQEMMAIGVQPKELIMGEVRERRWKKIQELAAPALENAVMFEDEPEPEEKEKAPKPTLGERFKALFR